MPSKNIPIVKAQLVKTMNTFRDPIHQIISPIRRLEAIHSSYIISVIYQFLLNINTKEERLEIGKIEIIFTNLFAIFVIIIAKRFMIKLLLLCTMVASIGWHLYGVGWVHLGDKKAWGRWDNVFFMHGNCSICNDMDTANIAGPFKKTLPKIYRRGWFRPSLKIIINIVLTIAVGIVAITYREYKITIFNVKFSWGDLLAFSFIGIALWPYFLLLYQKINRNTNFRFLGQCWYNIRYFGIFVKTKR